MSNIFTPGPTSNTFRASDGRILTAPEGWILLPPGDAALTRRVKESGEHWIVQEKRGRKIFSRGVWAPAATIDRIRTELEAERCTESYAKRKKADARRREKAQAEYVEDFHGAVLAFLAFHPTHADLADRLAHAVTDHATPVGSGTVARTKRIPVEKRAESAVIAWMRHQTTAYDTMTIPRSRGSSRCQRVSVMSCFMTGVPRGFQDGLPITKQRIAGQTVHFFRTILLRIPITSKGEARWHEEMMTRTSRRIGSSHAWPLSRFASRIGPSM